MGLLAFWPNGSRSTHQASMDCLSMMAWTGLKNGWVFVWLGEKKCRSMLRRWCFEPNQIIAKVIDYNDQETMHP